MDDPGEQYCDLGTVLEIFSEEQNREKFEIQQVLSRSPSFLFYICEISLSEEVSIDYKLKFFIFLNRNYQILKDYPEKMRLMLNYMVRLLSLDSTLDNILAELIVNMSCRFECITDFDVYSLIEQLFQDERYVIAALSLTKFKAVDNYDPFSEVTINYLLLCLEKYPRYVIDFFCIDYQLYNDIVLSEIVPYIYRCYEQLDCDTLISASQLIASMLFINPEDEMLSTFISDCLMTYSEVSISGVIDTFLEHHYMQQQIIPPHRNIIMAIIKAILEHDNDISHFSHEFLVDICISSEDIKKICFEKIQSLGVSYQAIRLITCCLDLFDNIPEDLVKLAKDGLLGKDKYFCLCFLANIPDIDYREQLFNDVIKIIYEVCLDDDEILVLTSFFQNVDCIHGSQETVYMLYKLISTTENIKFYDLLSLYIKVNSSFDLSLNSELYNYVVSSILCENQQNFLYVHLVRIFCSLIKYNDHPGEEIYHVNAKLLALIANQPSSDYEDFILYFRTLLLKYESNLFQILDVKLLTNQLTHIIHDGTPDVVSKSWQLISELVCVYGLQCIPSIDILLKCTSISDKYIHSIEYQANILIYCLECKVLSPEHILEIYQRSSKLYKTHRGANGEHYGRIVEAFGKALATV